MRDATGRPAGEYSSFAQVVQQHAAGFKARKRAFTFLAHGEEEAARLTHAELDSAGRTVAAALASRGAAGWPVLLLYPPGLEFVTAFVGCLYAGAIAVPAYAERRRGGRLAAILRDARPRLALTTSQVLPRVPAELDAIATDELDPGLGAGWQPPAIGPRDVAFLQYTSGSTAQPRGVRVTHGNLLANGQAIARAFRTSEETVVVGWLPVVHDMGLIGNVLQPLWCGGSCVLMAPMAFLQRPRRWLEAITRYRATTSGGPDFAYELCARKIPPGARNGLDLSSWQVAFNGAEPVRAETLERFAESFAPWGFRRRALQPCYGLAEATLLVTAACPETPPNERTVARDRLGCGETASAAATGGEAVKRLVGCGRANPGDRLLVVDPATRRPCPAGQVGEVWLAGAGVADGYWQRPQATRATFAAGLAGKDPGRFLRTGDLGFLDDDGELYLTGRLKDLIIVRGRNVYPQDVELTAGASHGALAAGGGAAFAVEADGEERLVVVHEIDRRRTAEAADAADSARRAVAEEHEVAAIVVVIGAGKLPRTTSGKVRRRACREAFVAGELAALATSGATPLELRLHDLLAPDADLRALDSLQAVELRSRFEDELGIRLPLELFLGETDVERVRAAALARLGGGTVGLPPVQAGETAGEHPLSHGQRSLWFLHRLAPRSSAYNMAFAARIRTAHGALDVAALRRALEALVVRHPALRTTYREVAGEPVQSAGEGGLDFAVVDAPASQRREEMLAAAEAPFDLRNGPVVRVRLFTGAPPVLLFAVHHVAADFRSLELLLDDLARLYPAPCPLPDVPFAFADYVAWHRRLLAGPEGERLLAWWRGQLAGVPAVLELPADRARPPVRSDRGDACRFALSRQLTRAVGGRAAAAGTTVYSVLLAAFQALIHRYTGSRSFVVGSPAAGRTRREFAAVVGSFVNLLPIPADLSGDPTASELIARTRRRVAAALEHQDLPFPLLVERLAVPRDAGRPPLVQVAFVLETPRRPATQGAAAFVLGHDGAEARCGELTLESVALPRRTVQFDLMLLMAEVGGSLLASLELATDLFDRATVARLAGHFRSLLAAAIAEPERRTSQLALLSAAERGQLLVEWNDTAAPPPALLVHERIAAHARERPAAVAVRFARGGREESLSYGELDRRARGLAGRLQELGVDREAVVGVVLDRSPELAVALVAALAAGGAFLAIEPADPPERIGWLLADSGAKVVVTAPASAPRLPSGPWRRVLIGDRGEPHAGRIAERRDLAFVIYTSGSTGRPKGVLLHHGGLANLIADAVARTRLGPGQRMLQFASLTFDASVAEIFMTLAAGATLFPVDDATRLSGRTLAAAISDRELTHAVFTPSVLGLLPERECPTLTTIIAGGEALRPELAGRWSAHRRLFNGYGPAEATIYATIFRCPAGQAESAIGRPAANARVYVVDRRLEPLPAAVPGEIVVAGAGVARGYLKRGALTAECFVPDPFTAPGERLYRTGDLARWHAGGHLEFLGRINAQLKVRGVRVEPGEIEALLARHPEVKAAAVARRGERLVAYVVPRGPARPSPAVLRRFLAQTLPEPMIPGAFVTLRALPLSRSGKVDRRALQELEDVVSPPAGAPPRSELERTLAAIWSEELGLESVGVDQNFFELGGHSLAMARIHARLCDALGREVPLVEMFSHPTVSALAAHLNGGEAGTADDEGVAAVQVRAAARGAAMSALLRPRTVRPGGAE